MTASASAGVGAVGAAVGAAAGKAGEFFNNLRKPETEEAEENLDDDPDREKEIPEVGEAETDSWLVVLQDGIPCALMLQEDPSEVA